MPSTTDMLPCEGPAAPVSEIESISAPGFAFSDALWSISVSPFSTSTVTAVSSSVVAVSSSATGASFT